MPKTAPIESKPAIRPRAEVGNLVLVGSEAPSLYVVTAVQTDTRNGNRFELLLIGPPRPNSSLGRVTRTVSEAEILAVYRAA